MTNLAFALNNGCLTPGYFALSEQITGARLVELDAAHLANVERSNEFNAAVLNFTIGK